MGRPRPRYDAAHLRECADALVHAGAVLYNKGWVANFTGSEIASRFPSFDQFIATLA